MSTSCLSADVYCAAVHVRPATLEDAEQIRVMYNHEVEASTATFDLVPRTIEEQRSWLQDRIGAFATLVATDDRPSEILGFATISPYKERAAYRTTVESSVYVHRDHHGHGIGRLLMQELIQVATTRGFHTIVARIESANTASVTLHEVVGYVTVGNEREVGRKFGRWLNVTVMQRML
jgi:L-amino acid N-acyltransferase